MIETIKNNSGKLITASSVVLLLGFVAGVYQFLESHFVLAGDFDNYRQQTVINERQRVKDRIEVIESKEFDGVATKYELLEKKQLERRLEELSGN